MPIKRTYAEDGDACATAHAMELLGDRWTYPVLRELMLGPKRFGELTATVRGVTPAVLTGRLRQLESVGLVRKVTLPPPAAVGAYEATEWARELAPIFSALGRWGVRSPLLPAEDTGLTPDAAAQSMMTMAPAPPSPVIECELRLRDGRDENAPWYDYRLHWADDGLVVERGTQSRPRARVEADSTTWIEVLYEGHSLDDVEVTGDRAEVERLVAAFREG